LACSLIICDKSVISLFSTINLGISFSTFYTDQISCILRNDPIISGIKFNDSEYLANQYADDTSLTLEDDPVSLERCLQIFDNGQLYQQYLMSEQDKCIHHSKNISKIQR
jgi:hypothetical protein